MYIRLEKVTEKTFQRVKAFAVKNQERFSQLSNGVENLSKAGFVMVRGATQVRGLTGHDSQVTEFTYEPNSFFIKIQETDKNSNADASFETKLWRNSASPGELHLTQNYRGPAGVYEREYVLKTDGTIAEVDQKVVLGAAR